MTNDLQIERLLFQQIQKPKNYTMMRAINVFGNYYRVNLYTETEENGLIKKRIGNNSYFCRLENNQLDIVNSYEIERSRNLQKKKT